MYLIDTHAHTYMESFDSDRTEMMQRAKEAGVGKCCLPNIDSESIERLQTVCAQYPGICFPMIGLHPTCVQAGYRKDLELIRKALDSQKYIAIGEIGIDLYWDKTYLKEQTAAFEELLRWSIEKQLPVAIHAREAFPQVFESLYKTGIDQLRGVFHSFGGSREELEEALKCPGFLIGINGVITYKKAGFRDYLAIAPIERIVLETDAPYLAPVPHRGKRNEPAYLPYIVQQLAEVYHLTAETVAKQTTKNAESLFGI